MADYKSDIEIAQEATMLPISEVAAKAGLTEDQLEHYGKVKAKVDINSMKDMPSRAKLILVTAINPTPAGEGKTTTSVGLADAMNLTGRQTMLCLREPSLGPVFGVKGGAAGGGYAQVVPMEDINLHFTGDFHAIGAANNLIAAMLDNAIKWDNKLNIDPRRVIWRRCVDMNDRQLRNVVDGMGGIPDGVPRQDGFDITVASEVMAAFCLATDLDDLKARLGRMVVAYTYDRKPVTVHDLNAEGACTALLKDAIKPNLVQTLENNPAFVHGGPFANIAHGCNSVMATTTAMKMADYVVTEAGFGADLGAEKFLDIKCRATGLTPSAVVIVATVRALKYNGGVPKSELTTENLEALEAGMPNLLQHVSNIKDVYGLPCVVAINAFPTDTKAELDLVEAKCKELGVNVALSEGRWPTRSCASATSRASSTSPMTWTSPSRRSSRPLPPRSTTPTALTWWVPLATSSSSSRTWASVACPSAWPRPSTPSPTTRTSLAPRVGGASPCATSRSALALASSWRSRATS